MTPAPISPHSRSAATTATEKLTDFFFLLDEWELAASGELGTLAQVEADIREAAARLLEPELSVG